MANLEQKLFVYKRNYPHHHVFGIILYLFPYIFSIVFAISRPLNETLREAAERQGTGKKQFSLVYLIVFYLARAFIRRQTLRDEKARKMRELTHRVQIYI